jgi:hypothetical protein
MRLLRARVTLTLACFALLLLAAGSLEAQLIDATKAPNAAGEGVKKSLTDQIGAGRGSVATPNSSLFIIKRDPFRAVRRGRQLFQRKFAVGEGLGTLTGDGSGDIGSNVSIGAGLADSCAACHGRPRGSAGVGGDVNTRPDSRDAPHLFGLGLIEQLADEVTTDLRNIRDQALFEARRFRRSVVGHMRSKGIDYGRITAFPSGFVDYSRLEGVDTDLRVKPFFAQGSQFSIRQFAVGAFDDEMGLEAFDPDLRAAAAGQRVVTPSGMVLDGRVDTLAAPPATSPLDDPDGDGVANEIDTALVDFMEFYLLHYFKPGLDRQTVFSNAGRSIFLQIGCGRCHIPELVVNRDRRVADVETVYDPVNGIFNRLFATAVPRLVEQVDNPSLPSLKLPNGAPFLVRNVFTDLKRHDLGPNFHERNWDGTIQKEFITEPLWGAGTTAPYGHDGRSINLRNVILRHGGEAATESARFANLSTNDQILVQEFLQTLILFPPDDTASNLNPGNRNAPGFPQAGHGSIALGALFNNPADPE